MHNKVGVLLCKSTTVRHPAVFYITAAKPSFNYTLPRRMIVEIRRNDKRSQKKIINDIFLNEWVCLQRSACYKYTVLQRKKESCKIYDLQSVIISE